MFDIVTTCCMLLWTMVSNHLFPVSKNAFSMVVVYKTFSKVLVRHFYTNVGNQEQQSQMKLGKYQ